jgi:hypothetical protein
MGRLDTIGENRRETAMNAMVLLGSHGGDLYDEFGG